MVTTIKCVYRNGRYDATTYFMTVGGIDSRKLYFIGSKEVTKDEGNDFYRELVKKYKIISKEITIVADNDEYVKMLEDTIDPHTCYIEDHRQMKEVENKNEKGYVIIRKVLS